MLTSSTVSPCVLDAADAPEWPGSTKPSSVVDTATKPPRLSPGPGILLWLHCTLIWSRSWASSIPVPSFSRPADFAAVVTKRALQELARCSWRAWAACKQPTVRREKKIEGVRENCMRKPRQWEMNFIGEQMRCVCVFVYTCLCVCASVCETVCGSTYRQWGKGISQQE